MTSSAWAGAHNLPASCSLEDAGCSVSSFDDQYTTSIQSGYFTTAAEWCTQMYIPESSWGNLTKVSTHLNFHMGNLNKVSTHSNFCMGNLSKVSTRLNFPRSHLNFHMGNLTKISTCLNFHMSNLTRVSTHSNFHTSNLTKVSTCSNFHTSSLAIWSQPARYNKPNLPADYIPSSRGCYNPHLTLLMLPFCTEKAEFMQSIYQIYGFVTGHTSKLFWWIYQSIPCTITNFADRYSEILNWISCLKIIAELPCWSISELMLSTHQNMMRRQDFVALKIKLYHYALKKQYRCKLYSRNFLFCLCRYALKKQYRYQTYARNLLFYFSKYRKLWVLLKISKNKNKTLSSKSKTTLSTTKCISINSNISSQPVHLKNYYGGHQTKVFSYDFLEPYLTPGYPNTLDMKGRYLYTDHVNDASLCLYPTENFVHTQIPLELLFPFLTLVQARKVALEKMDAKNIEEAGCAVCGLLKPSKELSRLKNVKNFLHVLERKGLTRIERKSDATKVREYPGPVLDYSCSRICDGCRMSVRKGKVPRLALAKGLWLGKVPDELKSLRFVEKLLIARVRHTCCYVKVASGMRKMKANVIAFQSPIPKVYDVLPPPRSEMNDVLAILFTGPCKPVESDLKRTPFLVRRNYVARALEWLRLNHSDYANIKISEKNLNEYPENEIPVSIEYRPSITNKVSEGTSVFDMEPEDGTDTGECSFTVHGLTGDMLDTMSTNTIKAMALRHLNNEGKILAVGHSENFESMWDNPQLYPQMFPWLFPYGIGGIGATELSDKEHKKWLLMYHDKRFQTDINFPFVAFSHSQMKQSSTQSYLLVDQSRFQHITERLLNLDQNVLADITVKLADGEFFHIMKE
jgi:hypothetical protein